MNDEHDDDMSAEVGEDAIGEVDQYAIVEEDIDEPTGDAERDRLREMQRNLEQAEGDDLHDE
jgi:hypothetical protein